MCCCGDKCICQHYNISTLQHHLSPLFVLVKDKTVHAYTPSTTTSSVCTEWTMSTKLQLVVLIAPFAPHIAEELWHALGNTTTVCDAAWPVFNPQYLVESEVQLTVSFNGKARFQKKFAADATNDEIQAAVLADEQSQKYLDGKTVVKVIVVPKKIVNVVIK